MRLPPARLALVALVALLVLAALPAGAEPPAQAPASREQVRLTFAPVVRQVAPAVVNIYTKRIVRAQVSPLFADPLFRQFFGEVPGLSRERVQRSLGSGVLIGADGTVITNHHVIKDADEVTVVLSDRREFEAKIVGSDERSDLAVLKIAAKGETFPTLVIGDSDRLEVGDLVLAIGNPFGVGQTVTQGIVSALSRTNVAGGSEVRSFIQTDASINPGNSGGALVDMDGRLIGINSAIYSKDGGSNGIGFAIPSALVRSVVASLSANGRVVRPWIGASGQAVTADLAQALGLPRPYGVLVNTLRPDSPAARAGLREGEVIVAVDGHEVDDPEALRFRLATRPLGSDVTLSVRHGTSERQIPVRLVAPPESPARDRTEIGGRTPLSGAVLVNLNPAVADELGLDSAASGVLIAEIRRGSLAERLGFQPGDLLVRVNDRPIPAVADAKRELAATPARWTLVINRGGETLSLSLGG